MEALTRLVADSLARHGFDRPIDPRRLQWSRWFRCDSTHSLLVVPSKPGIFALAEEIMDLGPIDTLGASKTHVETAAPGVGNSHVGSDAFGSLPRAESRGPASAPAPEGSTAREGHDFSRAVKSTKSVAALAAEAPTRRMLAVLQFSEDDDMAFTLDRMFTRINPLRARLASGRCFLRFVVIEDQAQRRSICNALNQWMLSSAEKVSGIGIDFQLSLELTDMGTARVGRTLLSDNADSTTTPDQTTKAVQDVAPKAPHLDSGANKNLHCPHPLPSGF
jgi:hypothetical protein